MRWLYRTLQSCSARARDHRLPHRIDNGLRGDALRVRPLVKLQLAGAQRGVHGARLEDEALRARVVEGFGALGRVRQREPKGLLEVLLAGVRLGEQQAGRRVRGAQDAQRPFGAGEDRLLLIIHMCASCPRQVEHDAAWAARRDSIVHATGSLRYD